MHLHPPRNKRRLTYFCGLKIWFFGGLFLGNKYGRGFASLLTLTCLSHLVMIERMGERDSLSFYYSAYKLLYSHIIHMQLYRYTCRIINQNTIERPSSEKNIPLTLFERVVWERELETEQNCNILTFPAPPDIAVCLSRSPGLLNGRPGGPVLCWVLFLYSIISPTLLILKNSLNFLCTELYNSSTHTQYLPITGHRNMHFRHLWNGMFDRHRVEITVMQFTGHSLPVHQFLTVPWDFNPVPYCQPSSLTPM